MSLRERAQPATGALGTPLIASAPADPGRGLKSAPTRETSPGGASMSLRERAQPATRALGTRLLARRLLNVRANRLFLPGFAACMFVAWFWGADRIGTSR